MTLKKKLTILLGITAVLAIGGIAMINPFTGEDEPKYGVEMTNERQQKKEIEIALSKKIYSEYKDVEKIEFNQWRHSKETGMWGITVNINNSNAMSFNFSDLKSINSLRGSSYNPKTFKLVKRDKKLNSNQVTIDKLKIKYSE